MRLKFVITIIFLFTLSINYAQQPEGTWVMAYIKAKQPVLSATLEQGELVFDEGAPFDSSEVYTPGLMVMQFEDEKTARSYSWDGSEAWTWKMTQDTLLMYSKKDTLFGNFGQERFLVSSTIDEVPTEYTFFKVSEDLKLDQIKPGWEGQVQVDEHPFSELNLKFEADTVTTSQTDLSDLELYLTNIGPLQVIEYSLDREYGKVELGIIYLFRERRKRYKGLFYPVIDDFRKPKEMSLELSLK